MSHPSPELQAKALMIDGLLTRAGIITPIPTKMTAYSSYFSSEESEAELLVADAWIAEQRDRRLIEGEWA